MKAASGLLFLILPEEYTSYFRSVIVFGTMGILEDDGEKRKAVEKLARNEKERALQVFNTALLYF